MHMHMFRPMNINFSHITLIAFLTAGCWSGWVFDSLALLSCSRYGLTQSELLQILEWCGHTSVGTYDWTVIAHAAGSALSHSSDGSIYIASHSLREVITQQLEGWFLTI